MFEALVLGLLQGVTEFFPISSTAHLIIVPRLLGFSGTTDTMAFDVALHAGTLLALVLVFWRDWIEIIRKDHKLLVLLITASLPAMFFGLLFEDRVEAGLRSPLIIAITLVSIGIVMILSERKEGAKGVGALRLTDALAVGLAQALALIPGVSRSGITIAVGLFLGMKREEAARFSFLLSMPIVAGAALFEGRKIGAGLFAEPALFFTGIAASALAGLFAIKYLLKFLARHPVNAFAYYRFALAFLVLWWAGHLRF
jgi:undecaprenyl-diphosphatase